MILYFAISILLILLSCYTSNFQSATHHWGRLLAEKDSLESEKEKIEKMEIGSEQKAEMMGYVDGYGVFNAGFQDVITPTMQTMRIWVTFFGTIALLIVGFFIFKWYVPLITLFAMFFIIAFLRKLFPASNSEFFKWKIIKYLNSRLRKFRIDNNILKIEAIEHFIKKIERTSSDLN